MVFVDLELDRAHLPSNDEREHVIDANDADKDYLIELQQLIEAQRHLLANLERTYRQVEDRVTRRKAFIAKLRYLPTEILVQIFTLIDYEPYNRHYHTRPPWWYGPRRVNTSFVSATEWRSRSPFNLSCVSWRWRDVALSTPKLWTVLVVDTHKHNPIEMMQHWFNCARGVDVEVHIWQEVFHSTRNRRLERTPDPHTIINTLRAVVRFLEPRVWQVPWLRISCEEEPEAFESAEAGQDMDLGVLFSSLACLPFFPLRSLVLDSMDIQLRATGRNSLLPAVSRELLRYVTSIHVRGFFLSQRFASALPIGLTTLKLDSPLYQSFREGARGHYADLWSVLSGLTSLERLRLRGDYPYKPFNSLPPFHPDNYVKLPRLRRLTVVGPRCIPYLSQVSTPNLEHLKLKDDGWRDEDGSSEEPLVWRQVERVLPRFLERVGGTVVKLSVVGFGPLVQTQPLQSWFEPMRAVQQLVLVQDSMMLRSMAVLLARSVGGGNGWVICPSLEVVEWESTTRSKSVDWSPLSVRQEVVVRPYMRASSISVDGAEESGMLGDVSVEYDDYRVNGDV